MTKADQLNISANANASGHGDHHRRTKRQRRDEPESLMRISFRRLYKLDETTGDPSCLWNLHIESSNGRKFSILIDPALVLKPQQLMAEIVSQTGRLAANEGDFIQQIKDLKAQSPAREIVLLGKSGWHSYTESGEKRYAFVTPRATWPKSAPYRFYRKGIIPPLDVLGQCRGTLEDWQVTCARLIGQSSTALTAVGGAFAAPLLRFADIPESFVLLLAGGSTEGKGVVQRAAMSVQGRVSQSAIQSPDASKRGITEFAAGCNSLMCHLEDLSRVSKPERRTFLRSLTYEVAGGGGKLIARSVRAK